MWRGWGWLLKIPNNVLGWKENVIFFFLYAGDGEKPGHQVWLKSVVPKHFFLGLTEGLSVNLELFPSRNVLFWLCSHLDCFRETGLFEEEGSLDRSCFPARDEHFHVDSGLDYNWLWTFLVIKVAGRRCSPEVCTAGWIIQGFPSQRLRNLGEKNQRAENFFFFEKRVISPVQAIQ